MTCHPDQAWRHSLWTWPLLFLIGVYRYVFSPLIHLLAPGSGCRYAPTCSHYAADALRHFGALKGSWLALRRILDCHPWGGHGHDPVPETWPGWRYSRRRLLERAEKEAEIRTRSSLPPAE